MGKIFINLHKDTKKTLEPLYVTVSGHLCGEYSSFNSDEYVALSTKAYKYCSKLYYDCKDILNTYYKKEYSDAYWEYYFVAWLKPFIFNITYKYSMIQRIVNKYKNEEIYTELLDYKKVDPVRTDNE